MSLFGNLFKGAAEEGKKGKKSELQPDGGLFGSASVFKADKKESADSQAAAIETNSKGRGASQKSKPAVADKDKSAGKAKHGPGAKSTKPNAANGKQLEGKPAAGAAVKAQAAARKRKAPKDEQTVSAASPTKKQKSADAKAQGAAQHTAKATPHASKKAEKAGKPASSAGVKSSGALGAMSSKQAAVAKTKPMSKKAAAPSSSADEDSDVPSGSEDVLEHETMSRGRNADNDAGPSGSGSEQGEDAHTYGVAADQAAASKRPRVGMHTIFMHSLHRLILAGFIFPVDASLTVGMHTRRQHGCCVSAFHVMA